MTQWHCRIGDRRYGPLTAQELKNLAASGELHRTDLVKREGDTAWAKASAVRGLFSPVGDPSGEPPAADVAALASHREAPAASTAPASTASVSPPDDAQAAVAPSGPHGRRKLSPRDMLGITAIAFSVLLILGAIWFAFGGKSSNTSLSGGTNLAASGMNPSSPVAPLPAVQPSAAAASTFAPPAAVSDEPQGQPQDDRAPDGAASPATPTPPASPLAASAASEPSQEIGAMPPEPVAVGAAPEEPLAAEGEAAPRPTPATSIEPAAPPTPASSLPVGVAPVPPVEPVQPADFQTPEPADAGPVAVTPLAAKPAAELPVGAAASAEVAPGTTAASVTSPSPDTRDDAYRQKLEQLLGQTKKTLDEAAAAQKEVAKVNNEIQQVQAAINAADVQIPQLTLRLTEIVNQLSGPPMPINQRQQLKAQGKTLEGQLMMLVQAKQNSERQLGITLQRKLKEVESQAADAAKKSDAVLPAWIDLSDPCGEQSRVAHAKMTESCTQWLAGDPEFIPAFLMRGFARWHAGEADGALQDFEQVVARAEGRTKTKNEQALLAAGLSGRSVLYAERKQEAEAKADFGKAAELGPKSVLVCVFRGRANAALGKTRSAVDDFLKATKMDSKSPVAFRELAWLLATSPALGEGKRAAEFGRIANELTGGSQWQCLDAYAVASAADGRFDAAIELGRKAVEAAPHDARPAIEQRLKLYQAGVVPTNVKQR